MKKTALRVLPAALVGGLFVAALFAPPRPLSARPGPALDALSGPLCYDLLESAASVDLFPVAAGHGVTQPLAVSGNIAACSLTVIPYTFDRPTVALVQWDPVTLSPDPTTLALRTQTFQLTSTTTSQVNMICIPPVILRSVPGVAEPPSTTLALDYHLDSSSTGNGIQYQSNSTSGLPVMLEYADGGPRTPVAGPHAVAAHAICAGDATLQGLYVAQSVMTVNGSLDSAYAVIQRFRVPAAVQLQWVEFALGYTVIDGTLNFGHLMILDAQGVTDPPLYLSPMTEADFSYDSGQIDPASGIWATHIDFATLPVLQANHDYWLYIRTFYDYRLLSRTLTGTERPEFKERIGPLYRQDTNFDSWHPVSDRALSFRVIGQPVSALDASLPRAPSRLRLSVAPNPSRSGTQVSWSGAAGALRLAIYDERGRRVGGYEAAPGASGRWIWSARGDDGRALPAGIYFLRASDDAGRTASERVVRVR